MDSNKLKLLSAYRKISSGYITPLSAFDSLNPKEAFLFESAEQNQKFGRYSMLGFDPILKITKSNGQVVIDGLDKHAFRSSNKLLDTLDQVLNLVEATNIEELPGFYSGLFGYLGYDVVREVENIGSELKSITKVPTAVLSIPGKVIIFDHFFHVAYVAVNKFLNPNKSAQSMELEMESEIEEIIAELGKSFSPNLKCYEAREIPEYNTAFSKEEYLEKVAICKEHIFAGDVYQIVLSNKFYLEFKGDPFELYKALRQLNPSPYLYYLKFADFTIVGSSPEFMVNLSGQKVTIRPIAGTSGRGSNPSEDEKLARELLSDPKERAEHVMLVDLARNDVGRISKFGSVNVSEFMVIEKFSHVMHLTSQVEGELKPGLSPISVIQSSMPAGTLSGAPKIRAMQIINDLEGLSRDVYAGCVGYIDFRGNLDLAIAIRTILIDPNSLAIVQSGGGIVADSDPEKEFQECLKKASAPLRAIGMIQT